MKFRIILGKTEVIRVSLIYERKDASAYHVYAGIALNVFRNCAANDGSCPEAQSIFDPSVRSASYCEGIAMRASPIKPCLPRCV